MDNAEVLDCLAAGRVVYLRGQVKDEMVEYFGSQAHVFREAGDEPVVVMLTTLGGGVLDGMIIYNMLRLIAQHRKVWLLASVTVQSVGLTMMMAVPGERRLAFGDTSFYGHHAKMGYKLECDGGIRDHEYEIAEYQASLDRHRRERQRLVDIVAEGTGMKSEDVTALYDAPRFLDVDEARKLGFISGILK